MQIIPEKHRKQAKFSYQKFYDQTNYIPVLVGGKSFQTQLSKRDIVT
jgi:hypothetical protein